MSATLTTRPITETIDYLLTQRQLDLQLARAALERRGIDPVERACCPPSNAELRSDYWYYLGMVSTLEELRDELD